MSETDFEEIMRRVNCSNMDKFDIENEKRDLVRYISDVKNGLNILNNSMIDIFSSELRTDSQNNTQASLEAWGGSISKTLDAVLGCIEKIDARLASVPTNDDVVDFVRRSIAPGVLDQNKQHFLFNKTLEHYDNRIKILSAQCRSLDDNQLDDMRAIKELEENIDRKFNQMNELLETHQSSPPCSTLISNTSLIHHSLQAKPPVFSDGYADTPIRFLKDLKTYIEFSKPNSANELHFLLKNSLDGEVKNWWYMINSAISTWEDFEKEFRGSFWNSTVQGNLKWKIGFGKYFPGKLSRVQYAIQLFTMGRDLDMTEEEVIVKLRNHFDRQVKYALLSWDTRDKILQTLGAIDADEKMNYNRQQRENNRQNGDQNEKENNANNPNNNKPNKPTNVNNNNNDNNQRKDIPNNNRQQKTRPPNAQRQVNAMDLEVIETVVDVHNETGN